MCRLCLEQSHKLVGDLFSGDEEDNIFLQKLQDLLKLSVSLSDEMNSYRAED